jgi:hypothetical protein
MPAISLADLRGASPMTAHAGVATLSGTLIRRA